MRAATMVVLSITLLSLTACTPAPLEFPDWTIPVPEGTRVIEYAGVSPEERTERIELVEDLVIGRDTDDPKYSFYSLRSVAVDDAGRIYVADAGDHQVKVYDENGDHLMNLGREGQGPGEFSGPGWATIAGSLLVVADMRLSIWDLSGQHLGDKMFGTNIPWSLAGRADGSVIARYPGITESGRQGGGGYRQVGLRGAGAGALSISARRRAALLPQSRGQASDLTRCGLGGALIRCGARGSRVHHPVRGEPGVCL